MAWKRTTLTIGALALLLLPAVAGAQAQPPAPAQGKSLSLSLDDCILRALKKNLAIQVAEFSPQLSENSVAEARAQYLPTMTLRFTPSHSENAAYSWLDTTGSTTVRLTTNVNGSVNQLTPLGGTSSLTASQNRSETNARARRKRGSRPRRCRSRIGLHILSAPLPPRSRRAPPAYP